MSNSTIGVTLGTDRAGGCGHLGVSKVADPSDSTCLAYMEADQRYDEAKQRHREAQERYQQVLANRDDSETVTAEYILATIRVGDDAPLEQAKSQRRKEYLDAYQGIRSSNADVMTKLLNADRWRCCKKFEPNRRVCPVKWLWVGASTALAPVAMP